MKRVNYEKMSEIQLDLEEYLYSSMALHFQEETFKYQQYLRNLKSWRKNIADGNSNLNKSYEESIK